MFKNLPDRKITQWPTLRLNYWGICKTGFSSMVLTLINRSAPVLTLEHLENEFKDKKWACFEDFGVTYITESQAASNGNLNFTVVRHPFARFVSMYKDLFIKRPNRGIKANIDPSWTLEHFAEWVQDKDDYDLDIHFKSQTSYLLGAPFDLMLFDLNNLSVSKSNFPRPLLRVNSTPGIKIENIEKIKSLVYERYRSDYNLLNYDLDSLDSI